MLKLMNRSLISSTVGIRYTVRNRFDRLFSDFSAIENIKNKFMGKTVFVIGSGPSLNRTPLDKLIGMPSIAMNKIDMIYEHTAWRPSAVVCVNSVVAGQHREKFSSSEVPIFLPTKSKVMLKGLPLENGGFFSIQPSYDFSTNLCSGVGRGETVTYTALQFAYWMGAANVVILGVDHSYGSSQANALKYEVREGDDKDHFDPNYFKSGQLWGVPDLIKSEHLYERAKEAFESDGRRIVDATIDGKLRVFDRISFDEALSLANAMDSSKP